MNIFATFPDPEQSARYLDDQRLVKMMTESIQMLCTCLHVIGQGSDELYRPTHADHPCNVWVREGRSNFEWLYEHALALQNEWRLRYGHDRDHAAILMFNQAKAYRLRKHLPVGRTRFKNCAANAMLGISFKHVKDTHLAYRQYLRARWRLQQEDYPKSRLAMCTFLPRLD